MLWDRRSIDENILIRTIDVLPNVLLPRDTSVQIMDAPDSDDELIGFLEGYVASIRDPKLIECRNFRIQKPRRQRGKVWDISVRLPQEPESSDAAQVSCIWGTCVSLMM